MFVRKLAYNLIKYNFVKEINGIAVELSISSTDGMLKDEFAENIILEMGAEAKAIILGLVPLALRININVHVVDISDVNIPTI